MAERIPMLLDWLNSLLFYQFLTPLFSLVMMSMLVSRKLRHEVSTPGLLLGGAIWLGVALVSLFPDRSMEALSFLGIKEGIRVLIFFGFIVLSFTCYKLLLQVDRLEQEITTLTREFAKSELKKSLALETKADRAKDEPGS